MVRRRQAGNPPPRKIAAEMTPWLAHLYAFCKGGDDGAGGTVPAQSAPAAFLELAELIDLHPALGEHGFNLQLRSHSSNHGLQSADVHIGAALHLRNRRLVDAEQVALSHVSKGVDVGHPSRNNVHLFFAEVVQW
jgi:hypothetical protein